MTARRRTSTTHHRAARLAALTLCALPGLGTRAEYAVFDLGPLVNIPGVSHASVSGVNAAGQVSLTSSPDGLAFRAFRYDNGALTNLGTLGGANSYAGSINAAGQVVGRADKTTAGVTHAFLWTFGGTTGAPVNPQMLDLTPTAVGNSQATAINASGQIAGYLAVPAQGKNTDDRAFVYTTGTITQIPLPSGGNLTNSYAYAINDAGHVVGEAYGGSATPHGFFYNGATSVEIDGLAGAGSSPLAINKNDRVVGYSTSTDGTDHAFVYAAGTITDLGTLGGHYSYANAINAGGQIVGGAFADDADNVFHAFTSDGTTMTDLNALVTSKAANWTLEEAKGVSDNGLIVGTGTLAGEGGAGGTRHGFLLRPLAAGDANADGRVDFADLVALAQHYNTTGDNTWETADFNGDGAVDFNDLVALAQNYNTTQFGAPTGPTATPAPFAADVQAAFAAVPPVPEPGALAGLTTAALLAAARRRRRRRRVNA